MTDSYSGSRSGTIYAIAEAALTQSSLPNGDTILYFLDSSLQDLSIDFSSDVADYSRAEILQLLANVACCVLYSDRDGMIHIEPLSNTLTNYVVDKARSYQFPEYSLSQEIKNIVVTYMSGKVTVQGSGYGNVQTVTNTLIPTQAQALRVGRWVANSLVNRKTLKSSYRADPRMDVLDRITVEHHYGQDSIVVVTSIKYTYTGAWKGEFEGRILDPYSSSGYSGESYSMVDGDIIFTLEE
jgi:hypothetical protein